MGPGSAAQALCVINISSHETGRPAGRGGGGGPGPMGPPLDPPVYVCRGRNSVLTMHGHNVQALLILIGR